MAASGGANRPDTSDMVMIHAVFRAELEAVPGRVRAVGGADLEQAGLVGAHYRFLLDLIGTHHLGEDALLWPKLNQRAPLEAALVRRMESQHTTIAGLLPEVAALLGRWGRSADPDAARELVDRLAQFNGALGEHLGEEEEGILPIAAEHLSVPEWAALREHSLRSVPPEWLPIVLGLCLRRLPPDRRGNFLAEVPHAAVAQWQGGGQRRYEDHMERLGAPSL